MSAPTPALPVDPAHALAVLTEIARGLPGVRADSQDNPAFLFDGQFLARLHDHLAVVVVRSAGADREALLARDPVTFFVTAEYAGADRALVRLGTATRADLAVAVEAAWRSVAPAHLVRGHDRARAR
ncbi:MAG TPA: hypothetical protein VF576_05350 [Rubricoccaceae bacterium]